MKTGCLRWILMTVGGLALLFAACVFLATLILGDHDRFSLGDGVGIVEVKGMIVDGQETISQLRALEKDDRAKAVVLRIDSPGGGWAPRRRSTPR